MRLRRTLISFSLGGLTAIGLAAPPAAAQTRADPARPAIVVRAEQCLRQNVDRVVAGDHDLASAANFLVTYVCAGEISGAARYQRNSAYVQMFTGIFNTMPQAGVAAAAASAATGKPASPTADFKASVDPDTGEIVTPPGAPGAPANPMAGMLPLMDGLFGQVAPEIVPVALRKLAGDLVLAAHAKSAASAH